MDGKGGEGRGWGVEGIEDVFINKVDGRTLLNDCHLLFVRHHSVFFIVHDDLPITECK